MLWFELKVEKESKGLFGSQTGWWFHKEILFPGCKCNQTLTLICIRSSERLSWRHWKRSMISDWCMKDRGQLGLHAVNLLPFQLNKWRYSLDNFLLSHQWWVSKSETNRVQRDQIFIGLNFLSCGQILYGYDWFALTLQQFKRSKNSKIRFRHFRVSNREIFISRNRTVDPKRPEIWLEGNSRDLQLPCK